MAKTHAFVAGIAFIVFFGALFSIAFSASGVSITPSSGEYSIKKGGGAIDILVTNYGDASEIFSAELYGEGAAFSTVSPASQPIGSKETVKFTVSISALNAVQETKYPLSVSVSSASSKASGNLEISFTSENGESMYTIAKIPGEIQSAETSLTNKLFTLFAAALLIGIGYYLIKSKGPWKD